LTVTPLAVRFRYTENKEKVKQTGFR